MSVTTHGAPISPAKTHEIYTATAHYITSRDEPSDITTGYTQWLRLKPSKAALLYSITGVSSERAEQIAPPFRNHTIWCAH